MSRSGYCDDLDNWAHIRWRGAVNSATKGNRGQKFLRKLAQTMDLLPRKRLVKEVLQDSDGDFCTIGIACHSQGLDLSKEYGPEDIAKQLGIAEALVREIIFMNDEHYYFETDEERWVRMRQWVEKQLAQTKEV